MLPGNKSRGDGSWGEVHMMRLSISKGKATRSYCRTQRQIETLYVMQNEQWIEHSRTMNQYKKELNTQHVTMKERFALHESDMHYLHKDIVQQLNEARALLLTIVSLKSGDHDRDWVRRGRGVTPSRVRRGSRGTRIRGLSSGRGKQVDSQLTFRA